MDRATGIWDMATVNKGGHKHDEGLVGAIATLYAPGSVADVGCGDGWYCQQLRYRYKWPLAHGYEGCADMVDKGVYNDVFVLDLTKRRWVGVAYDYVLCLEVGEHIPKAHEQVFLDNVVEFAARSRMVIMSWAVPGQGGRGHFNEQPNEYVVGEMGRRGFVADRFATGFLRERATLKWFRKTVVAYGRERAV